MDYFLKVGKERLIESFEFCAICAVEGSRLKYIFGGYSCFEKWQLVYRM